MLKKLVNFTLLFLVLSVGCVKAQDFKYENSGRKNHWFFATEAAFKIPMKVENTYYGRKTSEKNSRSRGLSLNATGGYFLLNQLSVGAGLGLNRFNSPGMNGFPVYGDVRFYSTESGDGFYALLDAGAYLRLNDGFPKGSFARLGLGYKFRVIGVDWLAGATYEYHHFKIKDADTTYDFPQTIGLSIGVMF